MVKFGLSGRDSRSLRVGVLALQGDFAEHAAILRRIGAEPVEVRLPGQLDGLDGLIVPGGESTTVGKLLVAYGLQEPLRRRAAAGFPIYGTCAGMILLAREASGGQPPLIGVMDIAVQRNAFGSQIDSFEADLPIPALGEPSFRAVFIRAPLIERVGPGVEVLARLPDGRIVAARQNRLLVSAFHPELTDDTRFHELFLRLVREQTALLDPGRAPVGAN